VRDETKLAMEILEPTKVELKDALVTSMQTHGLAKALDACRLDAPKIIEKAAADGFEVGRTSLHLRRAYLYQTPLPCLARILDTISA
jgi:hypothetical protein